MTEPVSVSDLVVREDLYPRNAVSDYHVAQLTKVMDGGHSLPPITVWRDNLWIADGVHRWTAAVRRGDETIDVEWRDYADDEAFFRESCLLNSGHGLGFTARDRLKIIEMGQQYGLKELDFATLLRTSESYIKTLMPRYAWVDAARQAGTDTLTSAKRRVPLKASTRHLSGTSITPAQADAIAGNAPGTSYLLVVRQLIGGLENDLLPPPDTHRVLWLELARLSDLIREATAAA